MCGPVIGRVRPLVRRADECVPGPRRRRGPRPGAGSGGHLRNFRRCTPPSEPMPRNCAIRVGTAGAELGAQVEHGPSARPATAEVPVSERSSPLHGGKQAGACLGVGLPAVAEPELQPKGCVASDFRLPHPQPSETDCAISRKLFRWRHASPALPRMRAACAELPAPTS